MKLKTAETKQPRDIKPGGPGSSLLVKRFKRDWQLHLLILLPVIYGAVFWYWPMYGVQIAFRSYRPKAGITGSEWVGMKWFIQFLTDYQFTEILINTLTLSLYSILVGFPLPIIFALFLNSIESKKFKRFTQTVSYIPHFLSITVLVAIIDMVFSSTSGVYGTIYKEIMDVGIAPDFKSLATTFPHLYVWSGVWQEIGWDTIIYMAALGSVSQELHEAAMIDGASKWKRIFNIDLPTILPTAGIMMIMRFGHVMSVGFEKVYLMQNPLNIDVSEVISTYVYKVGMGSVKDFSYGAAVGLFNSVVNCFMLVLVNWITKKISDREVSLF